MNASLSTARLLHRSLMAVATTALVFAVSLRSGTNFDAANNELEALTTVYPDEFEDFARVAQQDRSLLTKKDVIELINGPGQAANLEKGLGIELLLDQFDYQQTTPAWVIGPRFYGTLEELETDLQNEQVWHLHADSEELRKALAKEIREESLLNSAPGGALQFFALELRLARPDATTIDVTAVILPHHNIAAGFGTVTLSFSIKAHSRLREFPGLRTWFSETTQIGGTKAKDSVFPALEPFWNDISHMKPLRAYGAISALRESTKKDITVLGFMFAQDLAILAAPVAILLLSLYLFCHLSHVRRLAGEARENQEQLNSFPWIALFDERIARLVNDASIVVLPLLANAVLIWKSQGSSGLFVFVAAALSFFSIVFGLFARLRIGDLRRLVEAIDAVADQEEKQATATT
ncbi:MAG: hypothetical protein ACYTG0_38370 [Planctomycetota bacterium]|jgi:hypothetical protein